MKSTFLLVTGLLCMNMAFAQNSQAKVVTSESLQIVLKKKLDAINDSIYSAIASRKIRVYKDFTLKDSFKKAFGQDSKERSGILNRIKGLSMAYNKAGEEMSFSWLYAVKYNEDSSKVLAYGELCAFDIRQLPKAVSISSLQLLVAMGNLYKQDKKDPLRIIPQNVVDMYYADIYRVTQRLRSELQITFYRIKEQCLNQTPFLKNAVNDSFFNIINLSVYMTDTLVFKTANSKPRSVFYRSVYDFSGYNTILVLPDRIGLVCEQWELAPGIICPSKTVYLSRKLLMATQLSWVDFMFEELIK